MPYLVSLNDMKARNTLETMTRGISAVAIMRHEGSLPNTTEMVARIIFRKNPRSNAVTCCLHVVGMPPRIGRATGGGYDMDTAALESATEAPVPDGYSDLDNHTFPANVRNAALALRDALHAKGADGRHWRDTLVAAGFTVHNVI